MMKCGEVRRLLVALGYRLVRQSGSHEQWRHPQRPWRVTVAGYDGRDVTPPILKNVLKQIANRDDGMSYFVVYEQAPDGGWGAYPPDLPGVGVVAKSQDEARTYVRNAIALHLDGLREDGLPVPEPGTYAAEYVA